MTPPPQIDADGRGRDSTRAAARRRAWDGALVLLAAAGCTGCTPAPAGPRQAAQGIDVRVVKLPRAFTDPGEPGAGVQQPLPVPVHVFRGRVQPFEKPDPHHPALLRIVQPDGAGRFRLPLPPGEYTLVLELDGRLYLNNWLEDGSWATATVRPGQWTHYVIEDVLETD